MESMFVQALVFLGATVVTVPVAKRLGLGSVLGYLAAGCVIGPSGLQLIMDVEDTLHFAEFGVVLLLFLIGLELNPRRLWSMRRPIFGFGSSQVAVTTVVLTGLAWLVGLTFIEALIVGMVLSLSSTAFALQLIQERGLMRTDAGHAGFAVLLFQDLAVIPMLIIIPLMAGANGLSFYQMALSVGKGALMIVAVVVIGHYALRPAFRIIAGTRLREVFTAFSLLLVLGIAALANSVGLSMALGAFLAGVLLAESEYRHELEIDIEPFKGLLLGLFFIAVGMSIDAGTLLARPWLVLGATAAVVAAKFVVVYALARVFNVCGADRVRLAALLAQGGEFGFVLLGIATTENILPVAMEGTLFVVIALSMLATPLIVWLADQRIRSLVPDRADGGPPVPAALEHRPVILAGYGRFGQIVGRLLQANRVPMSIIEADPNQVELLRRFGQDVVYGDATRLDMLHAAGAAEARLIIVAIDDTVASLALVDRVRQHFPALPIMVRAHSRTHVYELLDRGVEIFEREYFGSAVQLGERALVMLGTEPARAQRAAEIFSQHDEAITRKLHPVHRDQDKMISIVKSARDDFNALMSSEQTAATSAPAPGAE